MNFNKIIIGGRITADIEKKQTNTGKTFIQFSVAVNQANKDNPADFFSCVAWDKTAENISKYFHKGNNILLDGEMHKREWTAQSGEKKFVWEVLVRNFDFVDSAQRETPTQEQMAMSEVKPNFKEIPDNEDLPF